MATIDDYIRSTIGETYMVLVDDGGYDGEDHDGVTKPDIFAIAPARSMSVLFRDGTTESDIDYSEFVKSYVADVSARWVIPVAIDYIMERTGLSDRIGPAPAGNQNLRNESRQHYNRVDALNRIDALLATRIAVNTKDFAVVADVLLRPNTGGRSFGIAVSSQGTGFLTADPDVWLTAYNPFVISPGFGVIAIRSDPLIVKQQTIYETGPAPVLP